MSSPKSVKSGFIGFLFLFISSSLNASPNLLLNYSLQAEAHDSEDDLIYSNLEINLSDDYNSSRLSANYDLTTDLFYEHLDNDDNIQWEGSLNTSYNFLKPLSLYVDLYLTEIGISGSNEIDQLNSQTFTTLITGIEYVLDTPIMGEFTVNLFSQVYVYEESPLDGKEDTIEFLYRYPLSSTSDLSTSYSRIDQQYDSEAESLNEAIIDRFRIEYEKRFSQLTLNILIDQNSIDYSNVQFEEDTDGYGLEISYRLNTRSTLLLSISSQVQQTFNINENLLLPQIPILEPGLVENDTITLQYDYQTAFNSLLLRYYQTDIRNLTELDSEQLEGGLVEFSQVINEKLSANLGYEQLKNYQNNNQLDLITANLSYRIAESRRTFSSISFQVEEGEENNISRDDSIIEFIFTGRIY